MSGKSSPYKTVLLHTAEALELLSKPTTLCVPSLASQAHSVSEGSPPGNVLRNDDRDAEEEHGCAAEGGVLEENVVTSRENAVTSEENAVTSDVMFCSACQCPFGDRSEQTFHYKTDWHRYNLKQRVRGRQSITEQSFEDITGAGDMSSLSGSDSDSDVSDDDDRPADVAPDEQCPTVHGLHYRSPHVFLRAHDGTVLSLYRCALYGKHDVPTSQDDVIDVVTSMPQRTTWAVLMTAGGHFAGAVFKNGEMSVHKTFHRYVVRARRGTAQSVHDKSRHAHSAGAGLRRYNEAALAQDIQSLLKSWADHLAACDRIFVRVPPHSRAIFFSGKPPPLDKADPRLRHVPFPTRRPTLRELQRVYAGVASLHCYARETRVEDLVAPPASRVAPATTRCTRSARSEMESPRGGRKTHQSDAGEREGGVSLENVTDGDEAVTLETQSTLIDLFELKQFEVMKKPRRRKKKKPDVVTVVEDPGVVVEAPVNTAPWVEFDEDHVRIRNQLFTLCKTADAQQLTEKLNELTLKYGTESPSTTTTNAAIDKDATELEAPVETSMLSHILHRPFGDKLRGLLHVAAMTGPPGAVTALLRAGADPSRCDAEDRTPYQLADTRPARMEFRLFRGEQPHRYNYSKAQIPEPPDAEREEERRLREAERRKLQKRTKREKDKVKKEEAGRQEEEDREKQRFLQLSDREKRALAAERRLAAQATSQGGTAPVLSRCFSCAADITGKVPFEYMEFKFCTTKCLREHRARSTSQS